MRVTIRMGKVSVTLGVGRIRATMRVRVRVRDSEEMPGYVGSCQRLK